MIPIKAGRHRQVYSRKKKSKFCAIRRHRRNRHVYVADFESRQFPGFDPGETARLHPYFHALEALRRAGGIPKDLGISCECGWNGEETIETKLENALKTMKDMLR